MRLTKHKKRNDMDRVLKTHVQGTKSTRVATGAALYAHHYTGNVHYAGGYMAGTEFVPTDKNVLKRQTVKEAARRKNMLAHLDRYEKRYNIDQWSNMSKS